MKVSTWIFAALTIIMICITTAVPVKGADIMEITDERGDVIWKGYVTCDVDGYGEIDVISLTSSASLQHVTVELRLEDDVTDEIGYIYSISISGVNVAYQEGQFQVWRWDNGPVEIENVQTGVNGDSITCIVPRTAITGDLILNATAQYYVPSGLDASQENYFDSIGDFGPGTRAPAIADLERDYSDPEGDVEMSYIDEEIVTDGSLDILIFSADLHEDLLFMMSLEGDVATDGSVNYSFIGGDVEARYLGGDRAYLFEDGEIEEELDDVEISGSDLRITVPGRYIDGSLGAVFAAARSEGEQGSYLLDMVPDDPYTYRDILPFPPGENEELHIFVQGPDHIQMKREFYGFSYREAEDIRNMFDADDDGSITEQEVKYHFHGLEDGTLAGIHEEDMKVDGRSGSLTMTLETEYLIGPVGSDDDIRFIWTMDFSFDAPKRDVHTIELDVETDPLKGSLIWSHARTSSGLHLVIELNMTWRLEPLTLEPDVICNYMDVDAARIDQEMDPVNAARFDIGDVHFQIFERSLADDDTSEEDDEPEGRFWVYIIILIAIIAVIVSIYLWSKSREMD
ncbi:MAG: hypothetical protein U9R75_10205 [Candidatus Thermoplasmatota archaeon]|nr:hypothetical protein [Candidatus Thermoplasmatota archaeon]